MRRHDARREGSAQIDAMAGDRTESLTTKAATKSLTDKALQGFGDLIRVLPSGTVFLFQFLNPLLTSNGDCGAANRYLAASLLAVCGFLCCFSSFTDSYTGSDGKLYYGVATSTRLWSFSDPNADSLDLSKYRLRFGDFVHAFFALLVFAAVSLLDKDSVACFYSGFEERGKAAVMVLPPVLGAAASAVFVVFPNTRHGIGYPPSESGGTNSDSSE